MLYFGNAAKPFGAKMNFIFSDAAGDTEANG